MQSVVSSSCKCVCGKERVSVCVSMCVGGCVWKCLGVCVREWFFFFVCVRERGLMQNVANSSLECVCKRGRVCVWVCERVCVGVDVKRCGSVCVCVCVFVGVGERLSAHSIIARVCVWESVWWVCVWESVWKSVCGVCERERVWVCVYAGVCVCLCVHMCQKAHHSGVSKKGCLRECVWRSVCSGRDRGSACVISCVRVYVYACVCMFMCVRQTECTCVRGRVSECVCVCVMYVRHTEYRVWQAGLPSNPLLPAHV